MSYCTNCGTEILNNAKFCPNCGTKVNLLESKIERRPPPKRRMQKGVVKSLKKEFTNTVTSELKETITENPFIENTINDSSFEIENERTTDITKKPSKKLIIIYLVISIFLLILGQESDEIIGVQYFSIFILVVYGIRHKKEKPFNWLLKIVLVLQLTLIFSIFMTQSEFFLYNLFSLLAGLSLLGLFIVILLLILKGNKK